MNFKQMQYALAVARHRNISKAAASLFISQPALSLQIKKLEEELGSPLFRREPQGVRLTTQGESFYKHAQVVEQAWYQLLDAIEREKGQVRRHLRIGIGTRVYTNHLFDPLMRFFDEHPEINVTFVTEVSGDFLSRLEDGSLDLALDRFPDAARASSKRFFSCELIAERQCVLTALDDPLAGLDTAALPQLKGKTIVTGLENSQEDKATRQAFEAHGIALTKVYRSDDIDTLMMLVERGKGIALGPRSFAAYFGIKAVPLVPESYLSLHFVCLRERMEDRELRLLKQHLLGICRQRSGEPRPAGNGAE